jgi:hypothetical protein
MIDLTIKVCKINDCGTFNENKDSICNYHKNIIEAFSNLEEKKNEM